MDVIDRVKVSRLALQNPGSMARLNLNTDGLITGTPSHANGAARTKRHLSCQLSDPVLRWSPSGVTTDKAMRRRALEQSPC